MEPLITALFIVYGVTVFALFLVFGVVNDLKAEVRKLTRERYERWN